MKRISIFICLFLLSSSIAWAEGNISVQVMYKGTPPQAGTIDVTKNKEICGEIVPDESLFVGPNSGIENAMIYLKDARGKIENKQFELKNEKCIFSPHVGFAPKGEFVVTNSDDVLHNAHAYIIKKGMRKTMLNTALPNKDNRIVNKRVFRESGLIKVECDVHEWMSAWIIVIDHPYFAVTDKEGKAEISNVPDGEYELVTFHETLGEKTKKVKVEDGKIAIVEFEMEGK